MRRRSVRCAVLGLLAWLAGCQTPQRSAAPAETATEPLSALDFLAGQWSYAEDGRVSEEHWTRPHGGTLLGVARTIESGQTVFFEYLRIEARPDGIVYLASPMGRCPPTAFRLVERAEGRAAFENPRHDYPQRVIYWRTPAGELAARIEGVENGQPRASEWHWTRIENNDGRP